MKTPGNIESLPTFSPLLNDEVIEKDYTKGIGGEDLSGQQTTQQPETPKQQEPEAQTQETPPPPQQDEQTVKDYTIDPDAAKMEDHTKGFSFDPSQQQGEGVGGEVPPETPQSDYGGEGGEAPVTDEYKLPEASAKEFAEMIGSAFSIYVPQFSYNIVKIDLNNVKFHVEQGNIRPEYEPILKECNRNSEESLKFSPEEMRMFEKSLQKYLEYKNVSYANPETAFWATVGILGTKQIFVVNKLIKENQKLVYDTIMATNPDYEFKKEKGKEKKKEEPEEKESKED